MVNFRTGVIFLAVMTLNACTRKEQFALPSSKAQAILAELDQAAQASIFPVMDNANYDTTAMRLTAFRSDSEWAILTEEIVWWPSGQGVEDVTSCYGHCSEAAYGPKHPKGKLFTLYPMDNSFWGTGEPIWPTEVSIRGAVVKTPPMRVLKSIYPNSEDYRYFFLLLDLVKQYREKFFATPEELKQFVPDLPVFMQLNEWRHPDLAGGELPSQTEAFRLLAEALATGHKSTYAPTERSNLDWERWTFRK